LHDDLQRQRQKRRQPDLHEDVQLVLPSSAVRLSRP
jgi:hypothetical protein